MHTTVGKVARITSAALSSGRRRWRWRLLASTCRDGWDGIIGIASPAQPSPACAHAASSQILLQTQETKSVVFARPSSSIRFVSPIPSIPSHPIRSTATKHPSAFRAVSQTHPSGYTSRLTLPKSFTCSNLIHRLPFPLRHSGSAQVQNKSPCEASTSRRSQPATTPPTPALRHLQLQEQVSTARHLLHHRSSESVHLFCSIHTYNHTHWSGRRKFRRWSRRVACTIHDHRPHLITSTLRPYNHFLHRHHKPRKEDSEGASNNYQTSSKTLALSLIGIPALLAVRP